VTTRQRGSRPFPPGNVKVDGLHPLAAGTVDGEFVLTWAHRTRFADVITRQDDSDYGPEEGTTYSVRAYRVDTNALLAEGAGNTTVAVCAFAYTGDVRIELESTRGGLVSLNKQTYVISYEASGTTTSVIAVDVVQIVIDGNDP